MNDPLLRSLLVVALALLSTRSRADEVNGAPGETSTEEVERCVTRHDNARQLRLNEQWFEARAAMNDCAADRCPLAIAADCRAWQEDLSRELPTLLVLVEPDGGRPARPEVSVELDDRRIELPDPPAPIELAPGPHHVRVTFPGKPAIFREFTLQRGEKNHLERFALAPSPPPGPRAALNPPPPIARPTRPIPSTTYLFSAGALVAFGGSTALLASALRERNEARATCAPSCAPSIRRSIQTRLVLADVSAGVGISLAALAVYSFLRRPTVAAESWLSNSTVFAGPGALTFGWQGHF